MDGLSLARDIVLRASESTRLLLSLVTAEARSNGKSVTLNVFASGDNAVIARFFARHAPR